MAFVNEKIPDADKQRIDFSKIEHPYHKSPILIPSEWTIDRERDIALINLGGGFGKNAQLPHFFILYWQGKTINAFLRSTFIGNFPTSDMELTWKLEFIGRLADVPEEEVINTLKEALFAYGYIGIEWRDKIKAIRFDFDGKHLTGG
jgi:hypothetical protein